MYHHSHTDWTQQNTESLTYLAEPSTLTQSRLTSLTTAEESYINSKASFRGHWVSKVNFIQVLP